MFKLKGYKSKYLLLEVLSIKRLITMVGILGIVCIALSLSGCTGSQVIAPSYQVQITGYNLDTTYAGSTQGYFGPSSQALSGTGLTLSGGQTFTDTITISDSAILLKHSIEQFSVTTPGFTLDSVTPSLPITLSPGDSVTVTLTLTAPNENYAGPVTYNLYTT